MAVVALLAAASIARAQESKVVILNHADSLVGRVINGEDTRELIGHVDITQGTVRILCDHAIEFRQRNFLQLEGNVIIKDGTSTLRAPRGVYHREERVAEAFDSVSLDDGKVRLTARYGQYRANPREGFFRDSVTIVDSASAITADSLTYYRTTRHSLAEGHVRIVSRNDNMTITGGRLEHDQPTQFSRMTIDPVLVQIDTAATPADTLVVRSLIMEAYRDSSRRMIAIDSVRMAGHDLAGLAGYVQFYSQGDSIHLRRRPMVWYQETQVSGDSINVYLFHRKLERVAVFGNAVAVSQSDSLHPGKFDQMVGDTMRMAFEKQALSRIDVSSRAIGVYHLYEDTSANGLNKISGDRILMRFGDRKLHTIKVVGGVEGQYFPENLVFKHEEQYAIPGATWRKERPRMVREGERVVVE